MTLNDLFEKTKNYKEEDIKLINKAYEYANYLHEGQIRQSGETYITHPLNVAYILTEMNADRDTICAALLHDTLEDTKATKEEIVELFNKDVANLVDGVTKISGSNFPNKIDQNLANTRKIITGIRNDVRIIIIKLADRLHNMRTLEFKSKPKQKEISLETMELFIPLAYNIGTYRMKSELEDLALQYLKPDNYKKIEEIKSNIELENNKFLEEMLYKINSILNNKNIPNEIKLRTKNIYGIYKKLNEGYKISDIHDLFSLKIMVDEIDNCYKTLGIIHNEYNPINDKFKDYICNPKTNMYSSLHTTLFGPNDKLIQTQIRTFDMDKVASFGLATYWDINKEDAKYIMKEKLNELQFFKTLEEIDSLYKRDDEFNKTINEELFTKKICVYMTNGIKIELPIGSTIIDLAYELGADIGNMLAAAIVNENYVSLEYQLKENDRIKIIIDNLQFGPKKEWLELAHTSIAKENIKKLTL